MAKVKIPDFMVPQYKLTVNNTEYSFEAGSLSEVPDNVADIIKNNNDMLPREDPPKQGMSGLDHTVTFRDDGGNPVAIYSVKDGVGNICAPSGVTAKRWVDADGSIVKFPVNPSADMVITADNIVRYSDMLYSKYSRSPETYPIITLCVGCGGNDIYLYFCKTVSGYMQGSGIFLAHDCWRGNFSAALDVKTMELGELIDLIIGSDMTLSYSGAEWAPNAPRVFTHGLDVATYPKCTDMDA